MVTFRQEKLGDESAIRRINEQGFGGSEEANIVDALRQANAIMLSMVALDGEDVVAHILFTEVEIVGADSQFKGLGLGPMAVLPSHQRKGIGIQLLQIALDKYRLLDYDLVSFWDILNFIRNSDFPLQNHMVPVASLMLRMRPSWFWNFGKTDWPGIAESCITGMNFEMNKYQKRAGPYV